MGDARTVSWDEFTKDCRAVLSISEGTHKGKPWFVVYGYASNGDFVRTEAPEIIGHLLKVARNAERKRILSNIGQVLKYGECEERDT